MLEPVSRLAERAIYGPRVELNELLSALFENSTAVSLHVSPTGDREKQNAIGETRQGWRDGLRVLAQKTKGDPTFKDVTVITATSWVVRVLGPMLEELGFHVDYENEDQAGKFFLTRYKLAHKFDKVPDKYRSVKPCFASISRTELLERYDPSVEPISQPNVSGQGL